MRNVMRGFAVAGVLSVLMGSAAFAASPANKAVAAGSKRVVTSGDAPLVDPILKATFKTSKPTDLLMSVTLECSILTAITTNNDDPMSTAQAKVVVWIDVDGKRVPIQSISTPPQDPEDQDAGNASDEITFCDREYSRTVTDGEGDGGIDTEDDYIRTKSSHGFNWVRLNTGSGMHTVTVWARLTEGPNEGVANTEATIGNRTLIIEPTKMANDAVIAETGTN